MAVHQEHRIFIKSGAVKRAVAESSAQAMVGSVATKAMAAVRVVMGVVFLWAFLDKTFGWGYATSSAGAWVNGGSPTKGFLGSVQVGPFDAMFRAWAGQGWADWLFMLALLGIGLALTLGVALRLAAACGTVLLLLMWAAEWPLARFNDAGAPTRSTNPLIDYHIIYALVLIVLAMASAGLTWGLGRKWAQLTGNRAWLR